VGENVQLPSKGFGFLGSVFDHVMISYFRLRASIFGKLIEAERDST
jgi:hypothetical protein